MSTQEEINTEVAAIHSQLNAAIVTAGEIESTVVNLGALLAAIDGQQTVSFAAVKNALTAAADAIDANGGNSSGLRSATNAIGNAQINFAPVKNALSEVENLLSSLATNLDRAASSGSDHLGAVSGMVSLLIDQSNYDGADQ